MPKRSRSLDNLEPTPTSRRRIERHAVKHCCWPKCGKPTTGNLPICAAHVEVVLTVSERQHDPDFVYRYRAPLTEPPTPEPTPSPAPAAPINGVVYYVRVGAYIKIGWSSDLAKRMRAYSPDSVLLATEPGDRQLETRRHRMFAAHRTHGREWYAMVPALLHHIDTITTEHGAPDPVTFAAKPVAIAQPRPKAYVGGNYRGHGLIGEQRAR